MFFETRRMRRVRNILRPYLGRDALSPARERLGEVELICMVVRVQNFESIVAKLSLRDLGDQMNKFYGAVADSIMNADGDLNRFCGATVVGHFNVLQKVEEARILDGAISAFQHAHKAFDAERAHESESEFAAASRSPGFSDRLIDILSQRSVPVKYVRTTLPGRARGSTYAKSSRPIFHGRKFLLSRGFQSNRIGKLRLKRWGFPPRVDERLIFSSQVLAQAPHEG